MAFGFKVKSIKTQKMYTIEEFYEAIKDVQFSAGEPIITKHGPSTVIVFPPQDRHNQVWILKSSFKKESNKWVVQKGEQAGIQNAAKNMLLSEITDGYSNLKTAFGSAPKETMRLVDETVKELAALNL